MYKFWISSFHYSPKGNNVISRNRSKALPQEIKGFPVMSFGHLHFGCPVLNTISHIAFLPVHCFLSHGPMKFRKCVRKALLRNA